LRVPRKNNCLVNALPRLSIRLSPKKASYFMPDMSQISSYYLWVHGRMYIGASYFSTLAFAGVKQYGEWDALETLPNAYTNPGNVGM
ncbi:MAG TPA: hypothetical protein VG738_12445, partial [Chitinophagaceae bacterium]|nr:hypothetical protein [Chitinophagaceae bacterium]